MEVRKNPKFNLDKKKGLHFNIGLCVALALVICAFEWKSEMLKMDLTANAVDDFFLEMEAELTVQPPPERPKPIVQPIIVDVPDDKIVEEAKDIVLDPDDILELDIDVEIPEPKAEKVEEIFEIVEHAPVPNGGMPNFYKFLSRNLKYPRQAQRMGIQGKVYVKFVVDENGNLTNIEAIKGIGGGCDEEAVRVLSLAPQWTPGRQRGRAVKVRMIVPVTFSLN